MSLVQVGNNSLMELLRILTSIELFFYADFYSQHPGFSSAVEENAEYFSQSINNLLPMSVSKECLDTGCMKDDLVRQEAIFNCCDKKWSSFLCIMGLASVLNRSIFTYYPDCGEQRSKLLFNRMIQPRLTPKEGLDDLHILFCYEGTVTAGKTFQPNHFVPLLFHTQQLKRKSTAACPQASAKKLKPSCIFPKKASNPPSNISKFFKVTEKSVLKPRAQFDYNKPSTSTDPRLNVSKVPMTPNAPKVECINFDVAMYRDMVRGMNSSEICNLIRNVFKPDKKYSFPKTNDRSFRYEWLHLYSWLCYSPLKDGAFCLSCVLFGDRFPGKAMKIKNLFSEPLRRWSGAAYTLKNHAGHGTGGEMGLHACTFPILTSLLFQMSGKAQPIEVILDTNLKKEIENNRKKLAPIVDSVIFCGRLGLPLRGHRDDSKYHPEVGSYSTDRVGNFIESLNFRVRAGDKGLEEHLKNCGKNKTYISKTSQNKIIKCCGQVISEQIIQDIKASKFYSIIADEAADSSHKEQMSFVLRFVDINMNIREEFIAFLECRWGLSGEQLAKRILEALNDMTLSIDDCRGQGYDGAGAVSGHINGLSANILRLNGKALYTHCYSHRLNLAVCDSLTVVEVNTMMKHVKDVSNFINISQTRNMPFEENVRNYSERESQKKKLVDVCRTRWVERIAGLDTFIELFVPLYDTLKEMRDNVEGNYRPNLVTDASNFFELIGKFEFIASLVISHNILDRLLPVTLLLQGKSIDIMDGIHLINTMKNDFINFRNSIDTFHDAWYAEAVDLARKVGIEESKPRTVGRQTSRSNPPYKTTSEYYKRTISIPFVDHINSALQHRFDTDSVNVYKGLSVIPTKMMSLKEKGKDWRDEFKVVAGFYIDDIPYPLALDAELSLWTSYWETFEGLLPDNISTTLKAISFDGFENIKVVLRILGTLPITSCECERTISALRTLKNYQRSTMVEERLNGLALMQIHQEIIPDVEKVIDKFAEGDTRLRFF